MRKRTLSFPLIAILSLFIFTACQKGDQGPTGPEGPAGPAGPAGPKGDSGVANVVYSDWLDVAFDPNIDETTGDTVSYTATVAAPQLSADILNSGEVKVYFNVNSSSDPVIFPLPYFDGGLIINSAFFTDTIVLVANSDVSTFTDSGQKFFQYRYVIIPGGVLATKPENISLDNYMDVKKYLKLKN